MFTYKAMCNENVKQYYLVVTDPCDDCPMNSTCQPQTDGSVVCVCPPGYTGTFCENYNGFCRTDPCLNAGTCMEMINNFTCICIHPLTGRFCGYDPIDECDSDPCINGSCTNLINSYNCTCDEGFTDDDCSTNIDECNPNPCMNNGRCVDSINDFTCNCVSPWIGIVCNINSISNCTDVNCSSRSCKLSVDHVHARQLLDTL